MILISYVITRMPATFHDFNMQHTSSIVDIQPQLFKSIHVAFLYKIPHFPAFFTSPAN